MDEIIPGLWIGDLPSALDVQNLKEHNIFSILSAMRGKITIHEVSFTPISVFAAESHGEKTPVDFYSTPNPAG